MRFLIELDGAVLDVQSAWYDMHVAAAKQVGWSTLDRRSYWRELRKAGDQSVLLRGARPAKVASYTQAFARLVESEPAIEAMHPHDSVEEVLRGLGDFGKCVAITLGLNYAGRRRQLDRIGLTPCFVRSERLSDDPRRRPGELKVLAEQEPRTLVVASNDALIRAGAAADFVTVGVSCGGCVAERLHQAGASVVYHTLEGLLESVKSGATDLIQAGLLPAPLG